MASSCSAVIDQMLRAGMPQLDVTQLQVNTSRVVRYGPQKRAWYRIWEMAGRRGRSFYVGAFGCWGLVETQRVEADVADIDAAERARLRQQTDLAREREDMRRAMRARRASLSARAAWAAAEPLERAIGYLVSKGVEPCNLRGEPDDVVLVPMIRYDKPREDALVGVQRIWPDGTKRFTKGTAKAGACVRLGDRPVGAVPVLLCEGIATGLSIRQAIDARLPVFAAFDAGNLVDVAEVLRDLWPDSPIGVCADDDYRTPGNPGLRYALHAARRCRRAQILRPQFAVRGGNKWTDFNDLHATEGLTSVREQLLPFIGFLEGL
jgi:putative DNA primase/helicase